MLNGTAMDEFQQLPGGKPPDFLRVPKHCVGKAKQPGVKNVANEVGDAVNYNLNSSYEWIIADFGNSVVGFDSDFFAIDTSGFSNPVASGSEFAVVLGDTVTGGDDSQLYLTYTIPEPSAAILLGLGMAAFLLHRRTRQTK